MCSFSVAVFKVDKWMRAQRALYNRLVTKSGQEQPKLSKAHEWTVKAWSFYKDHLLKVPSVVSVDVSFSSEYQQHTLHDTVRETVFDCVTDDMIDGLID